MNTDLQTFSDRCRSALKNAGYSVAEMTVRKMKDNQFGIGFRYRGEYFAWLVKDDEPSDVIFDHVIMDMKDRLKRIEIEKETSGMDRVCA